MFLRAHPLCVHCLDTHNRAVPAAVVDHIRPKVEGGTDDWRNLQSLCVQCHNGWKAREEGRSRTRTMPTPGGGEGISSDGRRDRTGGVARDAAKIGAWAIALLLVGATPVVAQTGATAGKLVSICDRSQEICLGFVAGAGDAFSLAEGMTGEDLACTPPGGATYAAMRDVGLAYLRGHPELADEPAVLALGLAWHEMWCDARP